MENNCRVGFEIKTVSNLLKREIGNSGSGKSWTAERMEKMGAEYRPVKEPLYKSRTDAYAGRTQHSSSSRRGR